MGAFLKQFATLIAGQMAGSNHKASFIVKTLRTGYVVSGSAIAITWYSAYRNQRIAPGTIAFPFPGLSKAAKRFKPDRPEKEFPQEASNSHMKGTGGTGPTALVGPLALNKGVQKANQLSGRYPYKWGGGHAQVGVPSFGIVGGPPGTSGTPAGYDCSGAVSAVLGAMGLIATPMTSGELAGWGVSGEGQYVTIYANATHTFMKLKINGTWTWFGTGSDREAKRGGPAWGNHDPNLRAYVARHPQGY